MYTRIIILFFSVLCCFGVSLRTFAQIVPFYHDALPESGDLTTDMVSGIHRFLDKKVLAVAHERQARWSFDFSDAGKFDESIASKRALLRKRLGVVDQRIEPLMQSYTATNSDPLAIETSSYHIKAVSWQVLDGLSAQGVLLYPKGRVKGRAVMIPDAGMPPEQLAGIIGDPEQPGFGAARELARQGWLVIIPLLIDLGYEYSGNKVLGLKAALTHREWIYRQAYMLGRHVIGYELQKIFAAIDWLEQQPAENGAPLGVAGYGEGGLLALYAAALETRVSQALVSGYFDKREDLWKTPIYRNVFGVLNDFGDSELAAMCWPRKLVVEHAQVSERSGFGKSASPGIITTPVFETAKREFDRALALVPPSKQHLYWIADGQQAVEKPFSAVAMKKFASLKIMPSKPDEAALPTPPKWLDMALRQEQNVSEMTDLVQRVFQLSEYSRDQTFWSKLKGDYTSQEMTKDTLREELWQQFGKLPIPSADFNTRARLLEKADRWTSYVVKLDVWDDVFTWGILVIPNDIKPGEKRPVMVCQHGLEQSPYYLINRDTSSRQYEYYAAMPLTLAENGYITFMPANPYVGEDHFRLLQRKANPLGLSIFSFIIGQHQRITAWLQAQQFVNGEKIGFFGLSYGGTTALRVPPIVKAYKLSMCIANFNQWVKKSTSIDLPFSYMYNAEYEIQDWDLGHTFDTAEKAALIAPRPFMAQRGSFDPVATDEMANHEYAKLRRHYMLSGLPEDRVKLTYFVGEHVTEVNSALKFIYKYLPLD
ncbi:alpha/beta hydrolase family protein [Parapedobacter pyrenivorans]|uniref:alpha/beta hydrolase family protein n=1 Tax=Parapedobacter pyrenivorans TaxID=1305674 RepID=UPI003340FC38